MRDMFTKLFTRVIIHVHVCVSKGQTILSLQWTQPWEDKTQKFWIYNLICCVKKKSHFLERWSKHVPHWPHDMCFQAFCLEIICSDPQGVLQVFPIWEFSTKNAEHFVFLSFKTSALLYILPCLLVLACSFGRSRCFRCCVNFFIIWQEPISIWWLLSSKERVQWALHWFLFQHTLAHVLIHQRKIDNDLRKEITKASILYPTMHFVSSRTQTFTQQENFLPIQFLIPLP